MRIKSWCTFFLLASFPIGLAAQVNSKKMKVIHVFVALCDNLNQGIVAVPTHLGNGQDPKGNLYWGAAYGVKTFFTRQPEWQKVQTIQLPEAHILERCIFKHKSKPFLLVADAYDGKQIKTCINHFLQAINGYRSESICLGDQTHPIGGGAALLGYVGHNGLMEFSLPHIPTPSDQKDRQAIILACASKAYFKSHLSSTHTYPLVWTTNLMAPEAYTLAAAIKGWMEEKSALEIQQMAAAAYHQYQKCGLRAAGRLLVTGY